MYKIAKYSNCWVIHNLENGEARKLTKDEKKQIIEEFPELLKKKVAGIYTDNVNNIQDKP